MDLFKSLQPCYLDVNVADADYGGSFHHQGDSYSDEEDFLGSEEEEEPEAFPLPRMRTLTVHNYS